MKNHIKKTQDEKIVKTKETKYKPSKNILFAIALIVTIKTAFKILEKIFDGKI